MKNWRALSTRGYHKIKIVLFTARGARDAIFEILHTEFSLSEYFVFIRQTKRRERNDPTVSSAFLRLRRSKNKQR